MITIEIKKALKMPGLNSAFLKFGEYREELVSALSFISIKFYHKLLKEWEFPIVILEKLIRIYQKYDLKIIIKKETFNKVIKIPEDYKFKTKPFQHQIEGIEYGLSHPKWILGDDQGLGKTKQIIDLVSILKKEGKLNQCLIICGVSSLRYNWEKEIKIHSDESCFVLGTRFQKNGKSYCDSIPERIKDLKTHKETFLITNAETLLKDEFVETLNSMRNSINLIAVDEAHKLSNSNSKRGDSLLKLVDFDYKIAMTGTPLRNSPLDAYTPLKWLGYEHSTLGVFNKFYRITSDDDFHEFLGYRHLDLLKKQLDSCMLRRLKEDVLDLPPKLHTTEFVEMNAKQEKIYSEIEEQIYENIDLILNSPNPLSQLIRLRQATGYTGILSSEIKESAKLTRMEELVEELVKNNQKAVIFSNWEKITQEARNRLEKYNPAYVAGSEVVGEDIEREKEKFQNDDTCKVIIGTMGKLGTGHTLTAAQTLIFLDVPWSPAEKSQNEDRVHRIGTRGTVNIITLVTKNTIDENIEKLIYEKRVVIGQIVKLPPEQKRGLIMELINRK